MWSDTAPARRITWGRPSREHLHRGESTVRAWSSGQARNPTVTTYTSSPCPTPPPVDANPNVRGALYLLRGRSRARIAGRVTRRRVLVGRGLPSPSMHMEIRGIAAPVSRRTRRGSRRSSRALRQTRSLSIPPAWQLPASGRCSLSRSRCSCRTTVHYERRQRCSPRRFSAGTTTPGRSLSGVDERHARWSSPGRCQRLAVRRSGSRRR